MFSQRKLEFPCELYSHLSWIIRGLRVFRGRPAAISIIITAIVILTMLTTRKLLSDASFLLGHKFNN